MQTSDNRYDETALSRLASELDVSRSTVSKVLRHCFGVNTETRQRVLRAAKGINELRPTGTCSVYCIIPEYARLFSGRRCGAGSATRSRDTVPERNLS